MKSISVLRLLLIVAVSSCTAPAFAGLFGSKGTNDAAASGEVRGNRRYILQLPDKKTEKELLDLFQAKKLLGEDVAILTRLEKQRQAKLDSLQDLLQNEYAIERDIRYTYERSENAIYALTFPAGSAKSNAAPEKVLHKKLDRADDGARFLNLMKAKDNALTESQVLAVIGREKLDEMKKVDDLLSQKFTLKPGHFYNYDDKSMTLYEMMSPSPKGPPEK